METHALGSSPSTSTAKTTRESSARTDQTPVKEHSVNVMLNLLRNIMELKMLGKSQDTDSGLINRDIL